MVRLPRQSTGLAFISVSVRGAVGSNHFQMGGRFLVESDSGFSSPSFFFRSKGANHSFNNPPVSSLRGFLVRSCDSSSVSGVMLCSEDWACASRILRVVSDKAGLGLSVAITDSCP